MTFALIFDNNSYQFAQLIATEKKHSVVSLIDNPAEKKIKNENLIYSFNAVPEQIMPQLTEFRDGFDHELLWEMCEEKATWSWEELVSLYCSHDNEINRLGLFLAINDPAVYFVYQGEQAFKRCSREEINERKLQLQKMREYQAKFDAVYKDLLALKQPEWSCDPLSLLSKPDKNSLEYKAVTKAGKELKLSLTELLYKLGYITSIEDLLFKNFQKHYFPHGTELAELTITDHSDEIPLNQQIQIFSIDDALTTEIDDAFSVQKLADGWIIGVHISAPSLNRELLDIASERISTVYYPGHKITMLPENVIAHYSLDQGKTLPVVSIYFTLDNELNIVSQESQLERVLVGSNLRIEELEQYFNNENLEQEHGYPYEQELKLLHKFALKLEEKRGKTSVNQLVLDYNFSFAADGQIQIKPRVRGNPIDKLVSELMIQANCSWGRMLTNAFIPAIYRVKQPMYPVVMTLTPNSHTGLNVDYYTWATSPLRRAADLVNQAQIISLLTNKKPLAATDFAVANVVENFDDTYAAYLKFQDSMERYWSLRYFEQEQISQISATYTYRNNVQLEGVPISIDMGAHGKAQPPGTVITLAISNLNFINQTFDFRVVG